MGFWDDLGSFAQGAAPWVGAGLQLYDAYSSRGNRDDLAALYGQAEREKYANAQANREAYLDYIGKAYGQGDGGRGAAIAGAHAASEGARLGAGKKAIKRMNRLYKQGRKDLAPYRAAGQMLLPQATHTASQALQGMNLMNAYLHTPAQLAKLNQSGPAAQVAAKAGYKLPEHMTKG
jgi:hypothetical protein